MTFPHFSVPQIIPHSASFFRIPHSAKYPWSPFRIPQSILALIVVACEGDVLICAALAMRTADRMNNSIAIRTADCACVPQSPDGAYSAVFVTPILTVTGTFVPENFRSRERKFRRWNFFPGTFVPWNFRLRELSFPGTFVP